MSAPDKDGWIEWAGGDKMPAVLDGKSADIMSRRRVPYWMDAPQHLRWSHENRDDDIIAYRVAEPTAAARLHAQPEPDGFTHESPIRAFTDWTVNGRYAIGKGFRPSLQHLTVYLDAMERLEGWALLQILEAASGSPSFVFRKVEQAAFDESFYRKIIAHRETRIDAAYERCAVIAENNSADIVAKAIREESRWEGLSCSCGGGWKTGHLSGCPEEPSDD